MKSSIMEDFFKKIVWKNWTRKTIGVSGVGWTFSETIFSIPRLEKKTLYSYLKTENKAIFRWKKYEESFRQTGNLVCRCVWYLRKYSRRFQIKRSSPFSRNHCFPLIIAVFGAYWYTEELKTNQNTGTVYGVDFIFQCAPIWLMIHRLVFIHS